MRPAFCTMLLFALGMMSGCGGSGGGPEGGSLILSASFAPATRTVPGYADSLRVTIAPPSGVALPSGLTNPFLLTRGENSRTIDKLAPSASPYALTMEALTDGAVVGTAQRSVFVSAGSSGSVDVSMNLQSEVASVAVEGELNAVIGDVEQYTAYAKDADGLTLFSGAGFSWTSSDPPSMSVDPDAGLAFPHSPGVPVIKATLKGTSLNGTLSVNVTSGGPPTVTTSPTATVNVSSSQTQFLAKATGLTSTDVTWSVLEPGGGTISPTGLYSAPVAPGTYTVKATSVADPAVFSLSTVIVQDSSPWTTTVLHPSGAWESAAYAIDGTTQAGFVDVGATSHAGVWSGTAASWTDLHPSGADDSVIYDTVAGQQIGTATFGDEVHASVWSGSAGSWTDIHPLSADEESYGYGASAGQQVGTAEMANVLHAGRWSGTAVSWVDMHPAGASASVVRGTDGATQVGYALIGGTYQAALWTGSAASFVSLQPEELGDRGSFALATQGGQQVGYASLSGPGQGYLHASLWSGTAASWHDLNPIGADHSVARGVFSGRQVGYAIVGGRRRAATWTGDLFSWRDLHCYLPARFGESDAFDVWSGGGVTRIVGWARDTTTGRTEAVMWVLGT